MKKICPNCLRLQEMSGEQCPACRTQLMDVEAWKRSRRFVDDQGFLQRRPPDDMDDQISSDSETSGDNNETAAGEPNEHARGMQNAVIPEAIALDEGPVPKMHRSSGIDMTKFVLGVLLSSLVFFLAFLAAYVTSELI